MRNVFLLLFILFSCSNAGYTKSFNITIDTVSVHIGSIFGPATDISITSALIDNGKYYCIFHEYNPYTSDQSSEHFLILSATGHILYNIPLPVTNPYEANFRLLHKGRHVLLKANDYQYFKLNLQKRQWESMKESNPDGYEDKHYRIRHMGFGEWGATTWFINKHTGKEYEMRCKGSNIILLNNVYYITGWGAVAVIKNPADLMQVPEGTYEYVQKNKGTVFFEGSKSVKGVEYRYYDSTLLSYFLEETKARIITSFQAYGELYQLYNEPNNTYIGIIHQGKIVPVLYLDRKYNAYEAVRNKKSNYRLLKFDMDNTNGGLIEIKDKEISTHHFRYERDTLQYQGPDHFPEFLHMLLQKGKPDTGFIEMAELKHKSTAMKLKQKSDQLLSSEQFTLKEFIRLQDSVFALHSSYTFERNGRRVHSATFKWREIASPKQKWDKTQSPLFINKQNELIQILIEALGQPQKQSDDNAPLHWQLSNGTSITLEGQTIPISDLQIEIRILWPQ
jgi:hypothetical protein